MLIVLCPKCKQTMKTEPKNIKTARKDCVYCGKNFQVKKYIVGYKL